MGDPLDRRALLRLAGAGVAGSLAGCSTTGAGVTPVGRSGLAADGWPGFGHGPGNTGHADDAGPTGYGSVAWASGFDDGRHDRPRSAGPVVADGLAFVASPTRLRALSLADGSVRWTRAGGSVSAPAVADGVCYRRVAGDDGSPVEAIDAATGEERWRRDLPRRYHHGGLTVGERAVFVAGGPRTLYALARDGGSRLWTAGEPVSLGAPALAHGRVYVTTTDGVAAYDPTDGSRRWRRDLYAFDAPAVTGDRVVVGTRSGVRAFTPDGEPAWGTDLDGQVRATPAIAAGTVVAATRAGTVNARSLADGTDRWRTPVGGGAVAPVAVAAGVVYVPVAGGAVVALSLADGSRRWRAEVPAGLRAQPAVAGGRLLAWDETNRATLLRSLRGGLAFPDVGRWRFRYGTPTNTNRAPAASLPTAPSVDWELPRANDVGQVLVAGGRLFHGSDDAITARSAASGRVDWQYTDVDPGDLPTVFTVGEDGVYVGVDDHLLCLAPGDADERVRWSVDLPTGYLITAATAVDGTVYATGTRAGEVAAIDGASGEVSWTVSRGPRFTHPPAVDGDRVYVGSIRGTALAIDRERGEVVGEAYFGGRGGPLAVADGVAYTVTEQDTVLAVDLPDATTRRWETAIDGETGAPLAVGERRLYVVTTGGRVIALERSTGDRVAETTLSGEFVAAPRLVGDALLVGGWAGSAGVVHALSTADLSERWRATVLDGPEYGGGGEGAVSTVVPVDGRVYAFGSGLAALR